MANAVRVGALAVAGGAARGARAGAGAAVDLIAGPPVTQEDRQKLLALQATAMATKKAAAIAAEKHAVETAAAQLRFLELRAAPQYRAAPPRGKVRFLNKLRENKIAKLSGALAVARTREDRARAKHNIAKALAVEEYARASTALLDKVTRDKMALKEKRESALAKILEDYNYTLAKIQADSRATKAKLRKEGVSNQNINRLEAGGRNLNRSRS